MRKHGGKIKILLILTMLVLILVVAVFSSEIVKKNTENKIEVVKENDEIIVELSYKEEKEIEIEVEQEKVEVLNKVPVEKENMDLSKDVCEKKEITDKNYVKKEKVLLKIENEIAEVTYIENSKKENDNQIIINKIQSNEADFVLPKEINGKTIEKIEEDAFEECLNLEVIKVPVELKEALTELKYFEINDKNKDEDYIELKTTREYSEAYIIYMSKTEEEREALEIIPDKFDVPLEEVYSAEMEEIYGVSSLYDSGDESSFDLRDYIRIDVEDQGNYGICYAYSTLTSLETNIALNRKEILDFSEVHAAFSTCGSGGNFYDIKAYCNESSLYLNGTQMSGAIKDGIRGPVYEVEWSKENLNKNTSLTNCNIINKSLSEEGNITSSQKKSVINEMKNAVEVIKEIKTVALPSISYEDKNKESKAQEVQDARLLIKEHIRNYGSLYASIHSGTYYRYNGLILQNYTGTEGTSHAVSIIGWDDNFSKEKFPEPIKPKSDGAYLVLNSWGEDWGNKGCFWVSYEDKWIESGLRGVVSTTEISKDSYLNNMTIKNADTGKIINSFDGFKNIVEKDINLEISLDIRNSDTNSLVNPNDLMVTLRNPIENINKPLRPTKKNGYIVVQLSTKDFKCKSDYIIDIQYNQTVISKSIRIEDEYEYVVKQDNTITLVDYKGKDLVDLVVPQRYAGRLVTGLGENLYSGNKLLETITVYSEITLIEENAIPEGVLILGNSGTEAQTYAMYNENWFAIIGKQKIEQPYWTFDISNRTLELTGNNSDYSMYRAPWYKLYKCIYNLNISDKVQKIGDFAFYGCNRIQEITGLEKVIDIGNYAFYGCYQIKNIKLSENLEFIGEKALENCSSIEEVIAYCNTPAVKELEDNYNYNYGIVHNYGDEKVEPTCTEKGYTATTCVRCKDSYNISYIEPLGHKEAISPALEVTCTQNGFNEFIYCQVCEEILSEKIEIEALGHDDEIINRIEPKCDEEGKIVYKCLKCSEVHEEKIEALGHVEKIDEKVEATCIQNGLTEGKHCEVCKKVLIVQEEIPIIEHEYGKWLVAKIPTYEDEGYEYRICRNCSIKDEKKLPKLTKEVSTNYIINDVDGNKCIIVPENTTSVEVLVNIVSNKELVVLDREENIIDFFEKLSTGCKIVIEEDKEEVYKVIIKGDVDGNSKIEFVGDIIRINNYRLDLIKLDQISVVAGDINDDGKIDFIEDIVRINNYRLGIIDSLTQ